MAVLVMLDNAPQHADESWFLRVEQSLSTQPDQWLAAIRTAGALSTDRAWALLSWVEVAATQVARSGSLDLVECAAFARSLLWKCELDRRDISVVESLLSRSAQVAGIHRADYAAAVKAGCARAVEFGAMAQESLLSASPSTPPSHAEEGAGASFAFRRRPASFDVEELERWLRGDR